MLYFLCHLQRSSCQRSPPCRVEQLWWRCRACHTSCKGRDVESRDSKIPGGYATVIVLHDRCPRCRGWGSQIRQCRWIMIHMVFAVFLIRREHGIYGQYSWREFVYKSYWIQHPQTHCKLTIGWGDKASDFWPHQSAYFRRHLIRGAVYAVGVFRRAKKEIFLSLTLVF